MKTVSFEDSKNKSSRSKGDLFELIVSLKLSTRYGLKLTEIKKEALVLEKKILKFKDGQERISEQYKRASIILLDLVKEIDDLVSIHGVPTKILWLGRRWQSKKSLSDVDVEFKDKHSIGISLKSTRSGKGTQKNLGAASLKRYLGLDMTVELDRMWGLVRKELASKKGVLSKLSDKGKGEIRGSKYKFPYIQQIGRKYSERVQVIGVDKSIELFNKLPKEKKIEFIKVIFGLEEVKPILHVTIEGNKSHIYWSDKILKALS